MKITLERFYQRHRGYVEVTAGYLEDRRIPFILQSCRLRPQLSMQQSLPPTPRLERWWVDEFSNTLRIGKNKRIKLIFNDLRIDRARVRCTDIFANLSIQDLYAISKLLYVCKAKDEITHNDVYILSFLGKDNYFRTRIYYEGKWDKNISTLYLGINVLKMIADNINIRYFLEMSRKGPVPIFPLEDVRQWVIALPAHHKFGLLLKSESKLMYKTIGLDIMETVWNG